MISNIEKAILLETIDDLLQYQSFKKFVDYPCESAWFDMCSEVDCIDGISFQSGATKGVIIIDDCDFVIKLPFCGGDDELDYCYVEWRNYLMACDVGIEQCFAETHYLGDRQGISVYAQEYCDCDECEVSSRLYNSAYKEWLEEEGLEDNEENNDEFCERYYDNDDDTYRPMIFDEWGRELANKFCDFCDEHLIGDLHQGNWAVGTTVKVVDFSGYGDIKIHFNQDYYGSQEEMREEWDKWFRICDLAIAFDAA